MLHPRDVRTTGPGSPLRKPARIVAAAAVLGVVVVGAIYLAEGAKLRREMFATASREGPVPDRFEVYSPGLRTPPAVPAGVAGLEDSEEVIGVEAGGRARAYRLGAMGDPSTHVINDVVGGRPVTVTYCDKSGCVRAFGGQAGGGPLEVGQGGLKGQEMVIRLGGLDYLQATGEPLGPRRAPFPVAGYPSTRTTWKAWREAHPGTDVHLGGPPARGSR